MRVGRRGVALDLGAEPLDVHVERLGVAEVVRAPDPVDEHVAREHPARVRQQELEQLELLERQRGDLAAHPDLVARGVDPHVADLELVGPVDLVGVDVARHPAQRGAHARDQLAQAERLRHVVVGADFEPDDGVDLAVAARSP